MSTPDVAIDLRGLRKRYGAVDALQGLDLQVPTGSIYGFLGRNGAGKTTTIKALMGMIRVTAGEGVRPRPPRRRYARTGSPSAAGRRMSARIALHGRR